MLTKTFTTRHGTFKYSKFSPKNSPSKIPSPPRSHVCPHNRHSTPHFGHFRLPSVPPKESTNYRRNLRLVGQPSRGTEGEIPRQQSSTKAREFRVGRRATEARRGWREALPKKIIWNSFITSRLDHEHKEEKYETVRIPTFYQSLIFPRGFVAFWHWKPEENSRNLALSVTSRGAVGTGLQNARHEPVQRMVYTRVSRLGNSWHRVSRREDSVCKSEFRGRLINF